MTWPTPIDWTPGGAVRILDQTLLPHREAYRELATVDAVAEAIVSLRVRGAPLIGIAAAMGVAAVLGAANGPGREAALALVDSAGDAVYGWPPQASNHSAEPPSERVKVRPMSEVTVHRDGFRPTPGAA